MNTVLLLLAALATAHALRMDDPCLLTTWSQPGCPAGTSGTVAVDVEQVRSCQAPSIWWNYPCGVLGATFTGRSAFRLCITGGLGLTSGITSIVAVAPDGTRTSVPFPSSGRPSCVSSSPSTKSVVLLFTANKMQTYGAGIDYTVA